jgi:hypothetical protein
LKARDIHAVYLAAIDEDSSAGMARGVWSEWPPAERRGRREETGARPSNRAICSTDAVVPIIPWQNKTNYGLEGEQVCLSKCDSVDNDLARLDAGR